MRVYRMRSRLSPWRCGAQAIADLDTERGPARERALPGRVDMRALKAQILCSLALAEEAVAWLARRAAAVPAGLTVGACRPSLDDLVGQCTQVHRNHEVLRLGAAGIEHQAEARRLLYRQVRRFGAAQDPVDQ